MIGKVVQMNIHQLDYAQNPVLGTQWKANDRTRLPLGDLINSFREPRVVKHIGHNKLLAVFRHPPGNSFADFEPDILQRLRSVSHRNREI